MNTASAYLDMHIVYSNSVGQMMSMRNMTGGLFNMNANDVLPSLGTNGYEAGDARVNQTPWLALWHSLLYRLHNYIAKRLATVNKHWDDDRLFNESRRISIAVYEHLTYNQWLPTVLGRKYAESKNLTCRRVDAGCGAYDASVDASTIDEAAHASFRHSHALVPDNVNFIANNGSKLKTMKLSDTVDKASLIETNYNDILRGMLYDRAEEKRLGYSKELRNLLFINKCDIGIDLFSIDMMRGRDFGVPPYIDFFTTCGLAAIKSWSNLKKYFSDRNFQLLKDIYEDFEDIDLLVGVMLERKSCGQNGVIGACTVGELFARHKTGNRFFYSFKDSPYPFSVGERSE